MNIKAVLFAVLTFISSIAFQSAAKADRIDPTTADRIVQSYQTKPIITAASWNKDHRTATFQIRFTRVANESVALNADDSVEIIIQDVSKGNIVSMMAHCQMPNGSIRIDGTNMYRLPNRPTSVKAVIRLGNSKFIAPSNFCYVGSVRWNADAVNNMRIYGSPEKLIALLP